MASCQQYGAWTLGKLEKVEYEWNPDLQYANKSYVIPDSPSADKVEYSCRIRPRYFLRKWRSREVKFICQPNGKWNKVLQ